MSKMYHPHELRSWANKRRTEYRIYHAESGTLLWSGSSLIYAERWLLEHLIPPEMPVKRLDSSVANAFKPKT